jgi:hypothetical protein
MRKQNNKTQAGSLSAARTLTNDAFNPSPTQTMRYRPSLVIAGVASAVLSLCVSDAASHYLTPHLHLTSLAVLQQLFLSIDGCVSLLHSRTTMRAEQAGTHQDLPP